MKEGAGRTREGDEGDREGAAGAWRALFLRAPYLRDALCTLGLVADTFETAVTWDRFAAFHASVMEATRAAAARVAGAAVVTCRLTHVYPDGAAPYFTVIAQGKPGGHVAIWPPPARGPCPGPASRYARRSRADPRRIAPGRRETC